MSALSLKQFKVNPTAKWPEETVHVIGRQSGLLAFFLSLMKIDPITELKCNNTRIEVTEASFFGRQTVTIPHSAVTGIVGGFKKPKLLFYLIVALVCIGLYSLLIPDVGFIITSCCLVSSLILAVLYFLSREMGLHVQNGGDNLWGLKFKRSVIENVAVDINKVNETVGVLNAKILDSQLGLPISATSPSTAPVT